MPIVGGKYEAPTWVNDAPPAVDASELQDMSDAIERSDHLTNLSFGQAYGSCSTAAATAAKTVSIPGFVLSAGAIVCIRFTNEVRTGATLNVNGTGANSIRYRGAFLTTGVIAAGDTAVLIYTGTVWNLVASDRNMIPGPQIETGAYTGTGEHGQSYPNTLTFGFVPSIVLISGFNAIFGAQHIGQAEDTAILNYDAMVNNNSAVNRSFDLMDGSANVFSLSDDDMTLTWYTTGTISQQQLNAENYEYYYVAIG